MINIFTSMDIYSFFLDGNGVNIQAVTFIC